MEEHLVLLVDPWQEKYERLLEAHEKLQKLNQCLEEKLLKLAEERQVETTQLSTQIQDLTQRLVEARVCIHQLEDENERYRNDINVAVQLLQCKPSNFVSPKIDTLPEELQRKVLGQKNGSGRKEKKIIKVQVPTFPPTDIMYAVDKTNKGGSGGGNGSHGGKQRGSAEKDIVSAAIMAKVLQERENERKENQKNRCHCASRIILPTVQKETQTMPSCTISYSDFPYLDDNGGTTTATQSNNNGDEDGDKYEDYLHHQHHNPYGYGTGTHHHHHHHIGRETSFSSHQSSSSLSSPTSSTTSECAQNGSRQHHLPHQLHHHHNQNQLQHHLPHHPTHNLLNHHLHSTQSSGGVGRSGGASGENEIRKLPGHCVRQGDEKESDNDMVDERGESRSSSSSSSNGAVVNWRTTVLVQHPPKSHSTGSNHNDSLSMLMASSASSSSSSSSSSKATPPSSLPLMPYSVSIPSSSHSSPPQTTVDHLLDSSEDSGLSCSSSSSICSQLPSALIPQLAHHVPNSAATVTTASATTTTTASAAIVRLSGQQQVNGFNNYSGMNPLNSPLSAYPPPQQSHQPHQYYRAQKRTFWTRSSSTTSTETEI